MGYGMEGYALDYKLMVGKGNQMFSNGRQEREAYQ
jgi:hypothetical protein